MIHVEGFHTKSKYSQDFDNKISGPALQKYLTSFTENTLSHKVRYFFYLEHKVNESD